MTFLVLAQRVLMYFPSRGLEKCSQTKEGESAGHSTGGIYLVCQIKRQWIWTILLGSILRQHIGLFTLNNSLSLTIMGTESGPKDMQGSAKMIRYSKQVPSKMMTQKKNLMFGLHKQERDHFYWTFSME